MTMRSRSFVRIWVLGFAVLFGLALVPSLASAQGGSGFGQLGSGFGQSGGFGQLGSGFGQSGGFGQLGSGFGQSGGSGQLGSGFGQSGGSGGSFLGSGQGFRPSSGTGLGNRLPTGASSSDPFGSFRNDPRSMGSATGGNTTGMGNNRTGSMTGMGNNRMGNMMGGNMTGMGMNNRMGNMSGFNQFGMNRGMNMMGGNMMGMNNQNMAQTVARPGYVLKNNIEVPPLPPRAELHTRWENSLRQSSSLRSLQNLTVRTDGDAVVLSGTVNTDSEKQLSEAILRLEPGVYNVRNELTVKAPAPNP
jgi:hypothetical protein